MQNQNFAGIVVQVFKALDPIGKDKFPIGSSALNT
jgi:hypothetical protein